jgi:ribosomal protein S18 acetylase RimI-like enzyme
MQSETTDPFIIEQLTGVVDRARLEAYLKLSDGWTIPALSERVDLSMFAEKILCHGVAVLGVDRRKVDVGLAAFYCNDRIHGRAFLTHLAVCPECRGYGLGKALVEYAKKHSRSARMTSMVLEVYRANESAKRFYTACGFVEKEFPQDNPPAPNSTYMFCSLQ